MSVPIYGIGAPTSIFSANSVLVLQFNFLENRIKESIDMFTGTGLYGELADATMASVVAYSIVL